MADIDIVDLLRGYIQHCEGVGIPKDALKINLMTEAAKEIERLRDRLAFQVDLAEDNNKSRLRYMDELISAQKAFQGLCKSIRETHCDDSVCGWCKYDADHGLDGYANECPGFERDDCFELDMEKWYEVIKEG